MEAIAKFILKSPDIPRPADIVAIISPPPQKPDWAVYVALHKKAAQGGWLYSDERAYIAQCDQYAINNMREQQQGYQEAKQQLESFKTTLMIE